MQRPNDMLKHLNQHIYAIGLLIVIDLAAVLMSFALAYFIRNYLLTFLFPGFFASELLPYTLQLFWWYPLVFIACIAYEKLYHKRLPFWIEVQGLLKTCTLTLFLTIVVLYFVSLGEEVSRSLVLITWLSATIALPLFRYYGKVLLLKYNIWTKPVIIIGNSESIAMIDGAFKREITMGYRVIGCIYSTANHQNKKINMACLGPLTDAERIVRNSGVEDLVIADPVLSSDRLVELTNSLQPLVRYITLVPDLFGVSLNGIEAAYFFEEQVVLLQIKNNLRSKFNSTIKRLFDLILGFTITFILLPLFLFIAVFIKLDSKGLVLYPNKRIGHGGHDFSCIKFRTMYLNSDLILEEYLAQNTQAQNEWMRYNKLITADPRVTRVGKFLRKTSLDELPQLINILRGEMSLVGPRPYLPREKEQMGSYANNILVGKPGLTGLWQVSGRNRLSFKSRLKLDSWYMKNWSLWLDVILLFKTVRVVVKKEGAY